jgi:hypothetical protein
MSLYLNTPEAVRAEHQYRTERLRQAARRPLFGFRRRVAAQQPATESARPMVVPLPTDQPSARSAAAGVPAQSSPSAEPGRPRAGAASRRHAA